jgi:hypothetical protein
MEISNNVCRQRCRTPGVHEVPNSSE